MTQPVPGVHENFAGEVEKRETPAPQSHLSGKPVSLTYTNWRGETSERTIKPRYVWFGSTEWHPEPQWLLTAFDLEKNADRDFALKDFGQPPAPQPREVGSAEITRLQKELETARRALEPFAEAARQADEGAARMGFAPSFDEYEVGWNFSFGQLRRARAALKNKEVADG